MSRKSAEHWRDGVALPHIHFIGTPNQSERDGQEVRLVVCHTTEGSYESAINWLRNKEAQASAHVVYDPVGNVAAQLVPWSRKAWACVSFNSISDNIEYAGTHEDFAHAVMNETRSAFVYARIIAFRIHKHNLPCHPSDDGLTKGYCRHYDLGVHGGGHTDPTTDIKVWNRFREMVAYQCRRGGFRHSWGRGR